MPLKLGILATHPIQYHAPLYRELATRPGLDTTVYYAHRATAADQAAAGFGVAFEWDVPLLDGYKSEFLPNVSTDPGPSHYRGCNTPTIADIIARERFDAFWVHGWYAKSYWQAIKACWRTGTPVMVRGDSTLQMATGRLKKLAKWVSHRRFIPRFDAYLVVGQRAKEYYLAYGADPSRMVSCPHFVDNDRFAKASEAARLTRSHLRARWGLAENAVVAMFVGKFIEKKRPLDFVRAITAAAESHPVSGLMIGDGPLRQDIERTIVETQAPVRLAGFMNQSEIPMAYAAADLIVLPSEGTETWGLVVNEAMACGLPAVVSDQVGCGPDLVIDGVTGFNFPRGNVARLSEILAQFGADPELAGRLGAAARDRVKLYSVTTAADGVCMAVERVAMPAGGSGCL